MTSDEKKRAKAGRDCVKKLQVASEAIDKYISACNRCNDGSRVRSVDDSRVILRGNMSEYASYLDSKYGEEA